MSTVNEGSVYKREIVQIREQGTICWDQCSDNCYEVDTSAFEIYLPDLSLDEDEFGVYTVFIDGDMIDPSYPPDYIISEVIIPDEYRNYNIPIDPLSISNITSEKEVYT